MKFWLQRALLLALIDLCWVIVLFDRWVPGRLLDWTYKTLGRIHRAVAHDQLRRQMGIK